MPKLASFSIAHLHGLPASIGEAPFIKMLTGHEIYSRPLVAQVQVKSLDKTTTHKTWNPFTDSGTTNRLIYASVNLSLSHHGSFEVQVDDEGQTIDTDAICNGARVIISMGKNNANKFIHLSGMIRSTGYTRGCENNLLYNFSGFGTGIRLNERVLDVLKTEPRTIDGILVDPTDPNFAANKIVDDALDDASYYPKPIEPHQVEGTGGYGHIISSGSVVDSPITDFIPGMLLRFSEISDLFNQIENYTGARIYVDESDRIQIQPTKTPLTTNLGFKITTQVNFDGDLADTTMYVDADQDYTFSDSMSKDAGYANSLYGILSTDPVPDPDLADDLDYFENKTVEVAQRFKPITSPNWRFYAGVEAVGMSNVQSENAVRTRWRICEDNNGVPVNTNGIIENRYMYPNRHYSTSEGGVQTIQISKTNPSVDLDENTWYWLIFSSVNATATEYWRWYYDQFIHNSNVVTAPAGTSSEDDGGSGWTAQPNLRMEFYQSRFKSEGHNCVDVLGVRRRLMVDSVIPNFPQQIISKQAAVKYMLGLMHYTARPRRIFDFPSVTIPNRPVFPGDTACIEDSRFGFSTAGNHVVGGEITDVGYSFGVKGAGNSSQSRGQDRLSLSVVAFPGQY